MINFQNVRLLNCDKTSLQLNEKHEVHFNQLKTDAIDLKGALLVPSFYNGFLDLRRIKKENVISKQKSMGITHAFILSDIDDILETRQICQKYEIVCKVGFDISEGAPNQIDNNMFIFVSSFEEGLLSDASMIAAKHNIPVVIRVSETLEELGRVNTLFNNTPVKVLEEFGILDRKCFLLGCVHLDKDDLDLIGMYGASIILEPEYSLLNALGTADTLAMKNAGIKIYTSILNDPFKEIYLIKNLTNLSLYDKMAMSYYDATLIATDKSAFGKEENEFVGGCRMNIVALNATEIQDATLQDIIFIV